MLLIDKDREIFSKRIKEHTYTRKLYIDMRYNEELYERMSCFMSVVIIYPSMILSLSYICYSYINATVNTFTALLLLIPVITIASFILLNIFGILSYVVQISIYLLEPIYLLFRRKINANGRSEMIKEIQLNIVYRLKRKYWEITTDKLLKELNSRWTKV